MAFHSESRELAISAFLYKNGVAQKEARAAGLQFICSRFISEVTAHEMRWCDSDGDVHTDIVIVRLSDYDLGLFCAFLEGRQPLPYDFSVLKKTMVRREMCEVIVIAYGLKYAFNWFKGAMKFPKALTRIQCSKIDAHLRLGFKSPLPDNMSLHSATEFVAGKSNVLRLGIEVADAMHLFTWQRDLGCFESYSRQHERYFHLFGSPR